MSSTYTYRPPKTPTSPSGALLVLACSLVFCLLSLAADAFLLLLLVGSLTATTGAIQSERGFKTITSLAFWVFFALLNDGAGVAIFSAALLDIAGGVINSSRATSSACTLCAKAKTDEQAKVNTDPRNFDFKIIMLYFIQQDTPTAYRWIMETIRAHLKKSGNCCILH